jgi:hypothetical protein
MRSSNRFGVRGTAAVFDVQVRSAGGTKTGTIFPAQQQAAGDSQRQLLPGYVTDIDVRGTLEQRVRIGTVGGLWISTEKGPVNRDVQIAAHLTQAAPAFRLQRATQCAPPQIFTWPGSLKLAIYLHRPDQVKIEALERRVVGL